MRCRYLLLLDQKTFLRICLLILTHLIKVIVNKRKVFIVVNLKLDLAPDLLFLNSPILVPDPVNNGPDPD